MYIIQLIGIRDYSGAVFEIISMNSILILFKDYILDTVTMTNSRTLFNGIIVDTVLMHNIN